MRNRVTKTVEAINKKINVEINDIGLNENLNALIIENFSKSISDKFVWCNLLC